MQLQELINLFFQFGIEFRFFGRFDPGFMKFCKLSAVEPKSAAPAAGFNDDAFGKIWIAQRFQGRVVGRTKKFFAYAGRLAQLFKIEFVDPFRLTWFDLIKSTRIRPYPTAVCTLIYYHLTAIVGR